MATLIPKADDEPEDPPLSVGPPERGKMKAPKTRPSGHAPSCRSDQLALTELSQAAMAAADELGSDKLHPEHLLAGLLVCAGPAREALEACGVTREAVLAAAEHLAGSDEDRGKVRSGRFHNPGATAVVARAHGLAIGSGAVTAKAEHVLMAFLWGPKADSLSHLLKRSGATLDMVVAELKKRVVTPVVPLPVPVAWGPPVRVTREEFERLALEARAAKRLYRFTYQGADVLVSFQEAD